MSVHSRLRRRERLQAALVTRFVSARMIGSSSGQTKEPSSNKPNMDYYLGSTGLPGSLPGLKSYYRQTNCTINVMYFEAFEELGGNSI